MKKIEKKDNRVRVGVFMPPELKKELKIISIEEGMFFQDVVTNFLQESVKKYHKEKE